MKKGSQKLFWLFLRYIILVVIAIPGFDLFYYLFMPVTVYPVAGILASFYNVILNGNIIYVGELTIEIIGACVAGAAYYFLLILNLATPNIHIKKRIEIIILSFGIFLGINILRIVALGFIYLEFNPIYEFTHQLFWYLGSTVFVVGIWFLMVRLFNIRKIPFITDLKYLYSQSSFGNRK